jgi:hypothetical protein
MSHFNISALCVGLLSLFVSFSIQAQTTTVVEKRIITSPAPKATCTTVEGSWKGNTWIASHEVCKYENRKEGVAWVDSYWSCTQVAGDGSCTTWTLVPGYWVQTLE